MPFKYKAELNTALKPCPATAAFELNEPKQAFRLVSATPCTAADFVPPGIMNPGMHRGRTPMCDSFALSFFATEREAANFYCRLKVKLENQHKQIRLGPYVAECQIRTGDGLCTPTRTSDGHFDLHEFNGTAIELASTTLHMVICGQP